MVNIEVQISHPFCISNLIPADQQYIMLIATSRMAQHWLFGCNFLLPKSAVSSRLLVNNALLMASDFNFSHLIRLKFLKKLLVSHKFIRYMQPCIEHKFLPIVGFHVMPPHNVEKRRTSIRWFLIMSKNDFEHEPSSRHKMIKSLFPIYINQLS